VSGDVETMEHSVARLEHGVAEVRSIVNRLEAKAVRLVEDLIGRQLSEAPAAAIWSDPLVRRAGITLADVLAGGRLDATSAPEPAPADPVDPQAEFDRLAEVYAAEADGDLSAGYRRASRAHPDLWQAAREAAYLDGSTQPNGVS
jgi:hypothetical protein